MRKLSAMCAGAAVATSIWLVDATVALAAPGGGTDDFGGGGGGGGSGSSGGSSGGGGGFSGGGGGGSSSRRDYSPSPRSSSGGDSSSGGGGGSADAGEMWAIGIMIALVAIGFAWYQWAAKQQALTEGVPSTSRRRSAPVRNRRFGPNRAARSERARKVELAAEEARTSDEAFAPETVTAAAVALHTDIVAAWTGRDRDALAGLLAHDLHAEWVLRLDDFARRGWHNITELRDEATVEYLGLVNREEDAGDRVTVRIEAMLRDYVLDTFGTRIRRKDEDDELTTLAEYWVLGKRAGRWILLSTEQDAEGGHHVESAIIASPWGDEQRIRDEAVTELGVAATVPDGLVGGLADVDFEGSARSAALEMAALDGRFAPDVLEAAVRRTVEAWSEAVDGDDAALLAVTTAEAAAELLYPGDPEEKVRLVVRGPVVRSISIVALEPAATPPTMTVHAEVSGRRYLQDRATTAVVDGSKDDQVTFTQRWTLALDGADDTPWRLTGGARSPRHV